MTAEPQLIKQSSSPAEPTSLAERKSPSNFENSSVEATGSSDSSLLVDNAHRASVVDGKRPTAATPASSPVVNPDNGGRPTKKLRLTADQRVVKIADAVSTILDCLDDDPMRQGLQKTPTRYAKALLALTEGYQHSAKGILGDAEFDESHTEMVLVRNIDVFSLCEHHLLPFYGSCHVAYIPNGTVVGLSKIARIVDMFSRRLQVQERLTTQIADAVAEATNAEGVFVLLTCTHMCMAMRGIRKVGAETTTTAARGQYASRGDLRQDFLRIVGADVSS